MEIKIKCPTCGKILRLQDNPNINNATYTCPVCKEKHKVGESERFVEKPKTTASEETQYGPSSQKQATGEETQYVSSARYQTNPDETRIYTAPEPKIGVLMDTLGRTYKLRVGVNSIGRKATTSPATVQIDTTDRTMSRNHAIIEVRNAGGQMIHILKNGANKNPSFHNGTLIGPSDQLILNNGDRVKFGCTELTFKK